MLLPEQAPRTGGPETPGVILAFDNYELDLPRFELRRDSQVVLVEPQVFEVLVYLVRNAARVVSKDELLDSVWPERYVTDGALNSRVMAARKAIGDSGKEQRYIKTVHGRGYRFVGEARCVSVAPETLPTSPQAGAPGALPAHPRPASPTAPATSFVGRDAELRRIAELLSQPACRLISIVGPGGVGKTRLALEASNRAVAAGRDAVFVPLEAVSEVREIPGAVAAALDLALHTAEPHTELLACLANRSDVLVLDNFEQIIEAAPFLDEMLRAAPGLTLLVTSRAVLGLAEEWVLRVSGLSLAEGLDSSDAVRLFLDRAAQANAWSVPPSADDVVRVSEICRVVDGMPLALELAASLSRYLTYDEIAAHIQRDLSVLSCDVRNAPGRHQSIMVLLEESCRQLAPRELSALESLAVFEGEFTAAAAEAVSGAPLVMLRKLVDHSLVQAGQGRFSLHPLMRQFAVERLGGRLEGLRENHARYYAGIAASLLPELEGRGQVQATQRVEADFINFASAWRWAAAHGRIDLLDPMAYPLSLALTFRGRFFDSHELLQHAITAAREAGDNARGLLAMLLTARAWVLFRFGRGAAAARDVEEALAIQAASGLPPRAGIGLDPRLALTALHHGGGDYGKAYETAMAVLEDGLAAGDRTAIAFASWLAGSARFRQANLICERQPDGTPLYSAVHDGESDAAVAEADRLERAARAVLLDMGDSWLSAYVQIELGLIAGANGDREGACEHYRHAYDLRRAFNDPQGMASSQVYLAGALADLGLVDEADALHGDIFRLAASIGDSNSLAEVERIMAAAAIVRGDCVQALEHARTAAQQSIAIGFTNNIAGVLGTLGKIFIAIREPALAARCFATIAVHPGSTPFSRAGSEMMLQSLSGTLSSSTLAIIRRGAVSDLGQAASEAIAVLEGMEPRLLAASLEPAVT